MLDRLKNLMTTRAPAAVVMVRIAVGWVFLSEGIQKFLYPAALGAGRMARIGIPWPEVVGPFVGSVEIICGALVLLGLLTRPAAVPLVLTMVVALVSTKLPILLGHGANNVLKAGMLGRLADFKLVLRFGAPAIVAAFVGVYVLKLLSEMPELGSYSFLGRQAVLTPLKRCSGSPAACFCSSRCCSGLGLSEPGISVTRVFCCYLLVPDLEQGDAPTRAAPTTQGQRAEVRGQEARPRRVHRAGERVPLRDGDTALAC